jgi:hypothetical protein
MIIVGKLDLFRPFFSFSLCPSAFLQVVSLVIGWRDDSVPDESRPTTPSIKISDQRGN